MGDITLQSIVVKAKTASIKRTIQSDIVEENKKKINKLKKYMEESKGKNVTALKRQLDKEGQFVNGLGELLMDMVEYIDAVCDDFEQLDRTYASKKLN